ncbi:unnamed protein product, partial [Vitrella brassicaformis CCMP3155]
HKAPFGVGEGHRLPPIPTDRSRVAQRVIEADRKQKQQAVLRAKEARCRRQQQEAYGRLVQQYYAPAPRHRQQYYNQGEEEPFSPYVDEQLYGGMTRLPPIVLTGTSLRRAG